MFNVIIQHHHRHVDLIKIILYIYWICSSYINCMRYNTVYQNDDLSSVYKMPKKHSMKLKVFIECRRDCSTKCNHSLFVYLANENECYSCLIECMSAFTQQAEKVGIQIKDIKKSNDPNLLSDSLYAPGKKVRRRHLRQDFITQEQFRKRSE
ncbi:unnamed protein product [Schistosoma rodhaini]|uniref:Uncharacterized protein n=1 Tax=Schistosoma mansoni TaxID=6183 RepID=A0A5K4FE23_SCHMA|nr:unnamed protein product [Schistosoma rodhaini]